MNIIMITIACAVRVIITVESANSTQKTMPEFVVKYVHVARGPVASTRFLETKVSNFYA